MVATNLDLLLQQYRSLFKDNGGSQSQTFSKTGHYSQVLQSKSCALRP